MAAAKGHKGQIDMLWTHSQQSINPVVQFWLLLCWCFLWRVECLTVSHFTYVHVLHCSTEFVGKGHRTTVIMRTVRTTGGLWTRRCNVQEDL